MPSKIVIEKKLKDFLKLFSIVNLCVTFEGSLCVAIKGVCPQAVFWVCIGEVIF